MSADQTPPPTFGTHPVATACPKLTAAYRAMVVNDGEAWLSRYAGMDGAETVLQAVLEAAQKRPTEETLRLAEEAIAAFREEAAMAGSGSALRRSMLQSKWPTIGSGLS